MNAEGLPDLEDTQEMTTNGFQQRRQQCWLQQIFQLPLIQVGSQTRANGGRLGSYPGRFF